MAPAVVHPWARSAACSQQWRESNARPLGLCFMSSAAAQPAPREGKGKEGTWAASGPLSEQCDLRKVDANLKHAHMTLAKIGAVASENIHAARMEERARRSREAPDATGDIVVPPEAAKCSSRQFTAIMENLYIVRMKDAHSVGRRAAMRQRQVRTSFEVMTRMLEMMQKFRVKPDYWFLSVMLECFAKYSDPRQPPRTAFDITNFMKKNGYEPQGTSRPHQSLQLP